MIQKKPMEPMAKNATRHPNAFANGRMMKGANREPAAAPLVNRPFARPRSSGGSIFAVTRSEQGHWKASPSPSRRRVQASDFAPTANAPPALPMDHMPTARAKTIRTENRSAR